ncbi:MAG: signal peptidase I [Muricoprocola sp.]
MALSMIILPQLGGFHVEIITSGSMEPSIHTGSVIYVREEADIDMLEVGTVITYVLNDSQTKVTHRILSIDRENGVVITKGDANEIPDAHAVSGEQIEGVVCGTVPYLGYVARLFMNIYGKLILTGIFLGMLEICHFWNLLVAGWKKGKETEEHRKRKKMVSCGGSRNHDRCRNRRCRQRVS